MDTICLVRTGSHLYGTDTPASDLDTQRVAVPDARVILLRRGIDSHGGLHSPKTPGAEDVTTHTLSRSALSAFSYSSPLSRLSVRPSSEVIPCPCSAPPSYASSPGSSWPDATSQCPS